MFTGSQKWRVVSGFLAGVTIFSILLLRGSSAHASRPLEYDEFLTVEYYTWAGLAPDGQVRGIRRASDLHNLPQPSILQFGLGNYRALGAWTEPNNHVVHSFFVNASLALSRSERVIRAPALLAGGAFVIVLLLLLAPELEFRSTAGLLAVSALVHPYVVRSSLEARGYTVMLLLQVVFIVLAMRLARRPERLILSVSMGIVATLMVVNVVSTLIQFVLPAYAALWIVVPALRLTSDDIASFRRSLLVQGVGVGCVLFVFFMDRLPYVVSSLQQYGDSAQDLSELSSLGRSLVAYWFPSWIWICWGIAALVGCVAMAAASDARRRFVGVLFVVTLVTSAVHWIAGMKLPYARATGYFFPFLVIGVGFVAEWCTARVPRRISWLLLPAIVVLATFGLTREGGRTSATTQKIREFQLGLTRIAQQRNARPYVILPPGDYWLTKFIPDSWVTAGDGPTALDHVSGVFLIADQADPLPAAPSGWEVLSPGYLYREIPGRMSHATGEQSSPVTRPLVVWFPDPFMVGLKGDAVESMLRDRGVRFVRRDHRYSAKLYVFTQLRAIEAVAVGLADDGDGSEWLSSALSRFGGEAFVLVVGESRPTDP